MTSLGERKRDLESDESKAEEREQIEAELESCTFVLMQECQSYIIFRHEIGQRVYKESLEKFLKDDGQATQLAIIFGKLIGPSSNSIPKGK